MEELLELRNYIEQQRYPEALHLIAEMEEMSREDKVNKIRSFIEILLIHLIKQAAEKRSTRSWELSIKHALQQIYRTNHRHKARGTYLNPEELANFITKSYLDAIEYAASEAFGGAFTPAQLGQMVDRQAVEQQALTLIQTYTEE